MVAALPEILEAEMKEKGPSLSHTIGYLLGWGVVEINYRPGGTKKWWNRWFYNPRSHYRNTQHS